MDRDTDVLAALERGWWLIPIVLVASLAGAAVFSADREPLYRASATLAAVPDTSLEDPSDVLRTVDVLDRRTMVATLSRITSSSVVRERAASVLEDRDAELERYRIEPSVLPNTYLMEVTVRGPEPGTAARLANAVAEASVAEAGRYYRVFALRLLDRAETPTRPVARSERRSYVVAGVVGLFAGVLAAFGVGLLRRT